MAILVYPKGNLNGSMNEFVIQAQWGSMDYYYRSRVAICMQIGDRGGGDDDDNDADDNVCIYKGEGSGYKARGWLAYRMRVCTRELLLQRLVVSSFVNRIAFRLAAFYSKPPTPTKPSSKQKKKEKDATREKILISGQY